jgi:hypothetical protein
MPEDSRVQTIITNHIGCVVDRSERVIDGSPLRRRYWIAYNAAVRRSLY